MPYILPFSQIGKDDIPSAGGKGANLAQLDLPVPPGFVITTEAYNDFIAANDLQAQIVELASQVLADDPASFKAASEKIRLVVRAVLPNALAAAIQDAYKQAGEEAGKSRSDSSQQMAQPFAVAVRSSATAEDLPSASFAGQQDTYLNIQGNAKLLKAVKDCWASLWTARAIAYRLRQGIAPNNVSLAVVVQQLVTAETAGILFTANPITGNRDEIMISAAWGLGEAVVGGLVTPDALVVDKINEQITSRETATKTVMTVRTPKGTTEQPVPDEQQNQPAINDATALQLARYGTQIETHYGIPMDIEWAVAAGEIAGDKIAILQARPITALPEPQATTSPAQPAVPAQPEPQAAAIPAQPAVPAQSTPPVLPEAESVPPSVSSAAPVQTVVPAVPAQAVTPLADVVWEPPYPNTVWMRRQIVEHMPEPLSPLFDDLYLHKGLAHALDYFLDAMSDMSGAEFDMNKFMPTGWTATINGYAYTTASAQMDGEALLIVLRIYANFGKFFQLDAFNWDDGVLPRYQALIEQWQAIDLSTTTDADLLRGIGELAAADASYWFGSAVKLGMSRITDSVFDALLKSPLVSYALPKPTPGSNSFLRGFDLKALDAQADMESLADTIRAIASLRKRVVNTTADQLLDILKASPNGYAVLDGIQHYLDTYGHQIYNLDFAAPTQNEDPLPVLLSLKALVQSPPEQDVRSRQAQMAAEREALVAQIEGDLNSVSLKLFRWVWKWTKHYAPYREHIMFYMGAAWPTVRKLAVELGGRLTEAGVIANPDDIYYLTSDEITSVINDRANGHDLPDYKNLPDLAGLAQERRDLRKARKLLTPPPVVPERGELKIGPISLAMFNPTPADAVNTGAVLNGYAVSTGRVTAPASVIHSIEDFDQMQPGSILVATTTTPAWTPLFSQAAGLVTDVGGALAHGSIVAREYGIPAVMGTGVATERIKSGMMLVVDGDAGTVTLLDEAPTAAELLAHPPAATSEPAILQKGLIALAVGLVLIGLVWLWKKKSNTERNNH